MYLGSQWIHKNAGRRISTEIIMRTMSQEKETIYYNITIWYTDLFLCLKPCRYPQQKQQWTKNGRNLKRSRRGTWPKVRNTSDVIDGARKEGRKVHFSSASQMTAAKVMNIISRLPGWAGQAADAVSAKTHVKMEDVPKLWKIPKSECPDIWIRLPRHIWPKSRSSVEDPVVPLERNLYGLPLARLLWERQFEKFLF